jgi:ABC-type multidrug transport system fused ATPase/permease subunit
VTKLNHYEENYQMRVEEARHKELGKLQKELFVWAISLVIMVISPTLASGATFIVYALANEDHILTASETFTVLLLFNALRFPINYFGRLLGRMAQAFASIDRVAEFLDRQVRADYYNLHDGEEHPSSEGNETVLTVKASFRIRAPKAVSDDSDVKSLSGKSDASSSFCRTESSIGLILGDGFEVAGIDFALKKGEILALVGKLDSPPNRHVWFGTFLSALVQTKSA